MSKIYSGSRTARETNMSVNQLKCKINRLRAEIAAIESKKEKENYKLLVEEVLNLLTGVGKGFVEADYYAPKRYYSQIPGVKNIRIYENLDRIEVKINSPKGTLLPQEIIIDGKKFRLELTLSRHFSETIDY